MGAAGSAAGVKPGMRFEVYAEGEAIKNPATGEVLSVKKTRYAVLRVTKVEEKLAWADIVKTFDDNGTQDPTPTASRIEQQMSVQSLGGGGADAGSPSAAPSSTHRDTSAISEADSRRRLTNASPSPSGIHGGM